MLKKTFISYLLLLSSTFFVVISCYGNNVQMFDEDPCNINNDTLLIYEFAHNSIPHQSAAIYGQYLITVPNKMGTISMYDMNQKQRVYTCIMAPLEGLDPYGNVKYHCNQCTFSNKKFMENDTFPLLYISQRADSLYRCSALVYRIVEKRNALNEIYSFDVQLVQTIIFPPMTKENALGNVNVVYSSSEDLFYLYSRNNNRKDSNFRKCRISKVQVPKIETDTIYLSNNDIMDSYGIECSALNMQGGAIFENKLYIAQGFYKSGAINIRVVNLIQKRLEKTYDLLSQGVTWEPEGCFFYEGNLHLASSRYIFQIKMNQK